MIKGTSQSFKFKLPCKYSDIEALKIIFWQEDYYGPSTERPLPIVKTMGQCFFGTNLNELYVKLSPEETLRFTEYKKAYVQFIAKLSGGEAIATRKTMFTAYPIYGNSLADDIEIPMPGIDDGDEYGSLDGGSVLDGGEFIMLNGENISNGNAYNSLDLNA